MWMIKLRKNIHLSCLFREDNNIISDVTLMNCIFLINYLINVRFPEIKIILTKREKINVLSKC
jgi:hypothetical protein